MPSTTGCLSFTLQLVPHDGGDAVSIGTINLDIPVDRPITQQDARQAIVNALRWDIEEAAQRDNRPRA